MVDLRRGQSEWILVSMARPGRVGAETLFGGQRPNRPPKDWVDGVGTINSTNHFVRNQIGTAKGWLVSKARSFSKFIAQPNGLCQHSGKMSVGIHRKQNLFAERKETVVSRRTTL